MLLDKSEKCGIIYLVPCAGIAHPVERHLAKVEVASSSLVARSNKKTFVKRQRFFVIYTELRCKACVLRHIQLVVFALLL